MDAHVAAQLTLAERREKLGKRHLHALQRQTYYLRLSLQPPVSHEASSQHWTTPPPPSRP